MPKNDHRPIRNRLKDDKLKHISISGGKYNDSAKLFQGDVVLTYAVSDKFNVGYNGTVQSRSAKLKENGLQQIAGGDLHCILMLIQPVYLD